MAASKTREIGIYQSKDGSSQAILQIGGVTVEHGFSKVPVAVEENQQSLGDEEWMVYFNINDQKFTRMLEEFCKLVSERLENNPKKYLLVTPETSTISMAYILRAKYGFDVQIIAKKKRPNSSAHVLADTYTAVTSTASNTLYFDGWDEGISPFYANERKEIVVLDNVVTSGQTFASVCRLLLRHDPHAVIREGIVMWTEGTSGPFTSIPVNESLKLPIHSIGGHIPILTTSQLAKFSPTPSSSSTQSLLQDEPTRFFFQSSSRFPSHFNPNRNILFCVFQTLDNVPAIAVVGPGTFPGTISESSSSSSSDSSSSNSLSPNRLWQDIPVRVHDACLTSECFFSTKCDCREQLAQATQYVVENTGIVIYLFQEGRGIGIAQKIRAYFLQTMAMLDTVEANRALGLPDDAREYIAVRDILNYFHIDSIKLMTNNPRKISELQKLGIKISGRISAEVTASSPQTAKYLHDKAMFMGHMIEASRWEEKLQTKDSANAILFYNPDEPYGWLSNFYPAPISIKGRTYPTTEHYYQSRKFVGSQEAHDAIVNAPTPDEAFRLSRVYAAQARPDWDVYKKRDMFRAVIFKFKQHKDLQEKLLATGDFPLIENSPLDPFWGCGPDGKGKNVLGHMLMNIRSMLSENVFDPENPLG